MAKISIVGAGPGSRDYVTPIARKVVQNADLVIGAERTIELFAEDIEGKTIKLTAKNLTASLNIAVESTKQGKSVVILSTGDPGFSGLLRTFSKIIADKTITVTVVPGISSLQVCAARLQIPWDEARLFSFHEGTSEERKDELVKVVKQGNVVMLLPDPKSFSPDEVAKFLLDKGVNGRTPTFVCENLTLADERIVKGDLSKVARVNFKALCVMVIKPSLQQ